MSTCPVGPAWDEFVNLIGNEADARTAYVIYNKSNPDPEIPPVDKARGILDNLRAEAPDDRFRKSADENKLERVKEQRAVLEAIASKLSTTAQQKTVIEKLLANNTKYREYLERHIASGKRSESHSVSGFIGSTEYSEPEKYEDTKNFGIFMHDLLENIQREAIAKEDTYAHLFTREFFDSTYAAFQAKHPFKINKLTPDIMYDMADQILRSIPENNGYVILPEITLTADTVNTNENTQDLVVGRLDLLVVDQRGNAFIFDFKTKKVHNMISKDAAGIPGKPNLSAALAELETKSSLINTTKAHAEFKNSKRNVYDTWTVQLQMYENMLRQNGISVGGQKIVGLLYQMNKENEFEGHLVHNFDGHAFYHYRTHESALNEKGEPVIIKKRELKLDKLRATIDKLVPISDEQKEERTSVINKGFPFDVSEKDNNELVKILQRMVDKDLIEISKQLAERNIKGSELEKLLHARRQTLRDFAQMLKYNTDSYESSLKMKHAFESIQADIVAVNELSNEALKNFTELNDTSKEAIAHGKLVMEAYTKMQMLRPAFNHIKQVLADARANGAPINDDNPIVRDSERLTTMIENIESNFRRVGLSQSIKVLMSLGEQTFSRVNEGLKQAYEKKLEKLEKELEDLKNGGSLSWRRNIAGWKIFSLINKDSAEDKYKHLSEDERKRARAIEALEKKVFFLQHVVRDGIKYDEAEINKFIEGVKDPDSHYYIGQNDSWGGNSILNNFRPDSLIASVSNSDMAIAAMTMLLKDAEALAIESTQNDPLLIATERALANFKKGRSVEDMNDMIMETREYVYTDENGNEQKSNGLYFISPLSVAYTQTIKDYNRNSRRLYKELQEIKAKVAGTPLAERAALKPELDAKTLEYERLKDKYLQWSRKNMSLKFVDKFYEYQSYLPADIRQRIQNLYMERELILLSVDRHSEEQLEELHPEDYERLHEIDIEISKVRQEAAKDKAEYQDYIDSINELFEYSINQNLFDRIRNNKKIEYGEDSELFRKWERDNMISVAKPEWYAEIEAIQEKIGMYLSKDPYLNDLYEKRKAVLKPYKTLGRFDPRFISKEDAEAIAEYDNMISDYKSFIKKHHGKLVLSEEDHFELNMLFADLNAISEKQINPYYQEDIENKTELLFKSRNLMNITRVQYNTAVAAGEEKIAEELLEKLSILETQFANDESVYRAWYDKNHINKYQSVLDGHDPRVGALPNAFNYENLPPVNRPDLMEKKPHPKYNLRKLKESAYNTEYRESEDGHPLPKGLKKVGDTYVIEPGYESSPYINENYKRLMTNADAFTFYNNAMKLFFSLQQQTQGNKLGYKVPGIAANSLENYMRHGTGAVKRNWKNWLDRNVNRHSQYDNVTNLYGDQGEQVRFRFNNQLPEELQTKDAINALLQWSYEAHYNIAMSDAKPMADSFIEYMNLLRNDLKSMPVKDAETHKRINGMNKVIEILEHERKKFIFGNTEDSTNKQIKKVINNVFAYTSMIRIGFDVANQAKNYVSGNIQAFFAAHSSDHYDRSHLAWAMGELYGMHGFIGSYLGDWGKITDVSAKTMMYRLYNPAQKDFIKYIDQTGGSKARRAASKLMNIQELGYMLQDKGDTAIAITVWLAIMKRYTYKMIDHIDENGVKVYKKDNEGNDVFVSAYDVYEKNDKGQLVIREDVDMSKEEERYLRRIVHSEMRRAQGNYAKADATAWERTIWGRMSFYFKKYLVPQMLNRLGYVRPNWEGQDVHYGYLRAVIDAFKYYGPLETSKHLLLGGFAPRLLKNNQMNALFTKKVGHASREILIGTLLMMLSAMAYGYLKNRDDDEEVDMLTGNMIRVLWGVKNETLSLNPIPVFGGADEYIRNFTNITSLTREFQSVSKVLMHGLALGYVKTFGGEEPDPEFDSLLYQLSYKAGIYQRATGPFEDGDPKLYKDLHDLTGFKNIRDFFSPEARLDIMQRTL